MNSYNKIPDSNLEVVRAQAYVRDMMTCLVVILLVQVSLAILRFSVLVDILGGIIMLIQVALGVSTVARNMDPFHLRAYGFLCFINAFMDMVTISIVYYIKRDLVQPNAWETVLRFTVPCVSLIGTWFAWYAYRGHPGMMPGGPAGGVTGNLYVDPFMVRESIYDRGSPLATDESAYRKGKYPPRDDVPLQSGTNFTGYGAPVR
mmetsp:Transcript_98999/g.171574  ORF Transcript_98999/g.171574 Transcript_98999/m.171574 type:complete len:204 (+) Transcript_98999:99-710(+)